MAPTNGDRIALSLHALLSLSCCSRKGTQTFIHTQTANDSHKAISMTSTGSLEGKQRESCLSDHQDLVKPSIWIRVTGELLTVLALFALCALPAHGQANVTGQWQTLPTQMPINPVHVAMMRNGKVLIVSGSGSLPSNDTYLAAVWDPTTDTVTTQPVPYDMFCNGMIVLPDGRPFIMSGTLQYSPPFFEGLPQTAAYDPATGNFVQLQSMEHGRWYPTATTLGNGSVMVYSGADENGATNQTVEIYTVGSGWSQPYQVPWNPVLYPRTHLLPNGTVFNSGSQTTSAIFNPTTHTWTGGVAITNYGGQRTYGTSVLLPLTPANNYDPRVMIMGGGSPATATTEIIDLGASNPQWVYGPNMSEARIEMDAVILPTGNVLALNGSVNDEDATTASLNADLYNPTTNKFSSAGAGSYARLYHSGALLLPDATVLVLGGNPERGTYEPHMEIYSPAYLFNSDGSLATRPTITSVTPGVIGYGGSFQIQTPNAANISSVVLVRAGSPTHAFDMDQRLVGLNFTAGNGVLNATAPPNGNIAPPGYYLLFILNSAGVPSVAQFVQLSLAPTDQPPTGIITNPSGNVTINPGQSVTFAGTGTSANSTIAAYSWVFPGGSPTSSSLANPGAVTYSSAPSITGVNPTSGLVGTAVTITATSTTSYVASLTVTDSLGVNDPSPPTRTTTVATGFGAMQGTSTVTFNGVPATPTNWTATSITVPVPSAATTGDVVVTVNGAASNAMYFQVTPVITSLSPTSGPVNTAVTITGTGFGSTQVVEAGQPSSSVTFNGVTATPTNWTATSITVPVPSGATTGNVVLTVHGVASNPVSFTVGSSSGPSIASLSPTTGALGAQVTITGTNFGSSQGTSTVTFNGTAATVTSWSATSIATTVPSGATTGNVVVTVGGVASNGVSFTVTGSGSGPTISSLSPTSGPVGTAVTITGTSFGSSQGTSTVTFNGTAATVTSWSATSIATTVPSGATTGNVVVTVGGVASNGVSFTVTLICGETGQSGTDNENADWAFATPCVTGSNANGYTPASIQYWVGSPTSTSFDLGIYADSSGFPGSLLCHTGTTTLTPTAGWNNLSLSGKGCPTLSVGTQYWIGYITGSNTIQQGMVSGTCPGTALVSVYASSVEGSAALPNPFGATSGTPSCYSMYLVLNNNTTAAPVITSASTASGTVGTAFSYTITASNSPTSYGATGLPSWASVNASTGVISGTPTAAGTSTVTVRATNASGTGSATLTITISAAAPVITSASTASGTVGTAFSYTITASNSPTSYGATGLPSWASVNASTGVISGTPTAGGPRR